ncbi:MAG: zinc-ribbon domain-containing protein, partial [Clostridia bacterium]|nr:zinc-ribbon domain-containing protein [Clostridia bacterium]
KNMFKGLRDEIVSLNADLKNITNCEKAKKLKKKLMLIGLPLAILGYVGVFICFFMFAAAGFSMVQSFGASGGAFNFLLPFILAIPCAFIAWIGSQITSLGLKIIITGYASNFADSVVGNNCPKCKNKISEDEIFCSKCGFALKIECPKCKNISSTKDEFCKKCGTKLK